MNGRDKAILEHIVRYCDEVEQTVELFGSSEESFQDSFVFRNAVSMRRYEVSENCRFRVYKISRVW